MGCGQSGDQVADAGLELAGGPLERRVGGLVGVTFGSGVGDAPMRGRGLAGEFGTDLPNPIAQRDHEVEMGADEAAKMLGGLPGDRKSVV